MILKCMQGMTLVLHTTIHDPDNQQGVAFAMQNQGGNNNNNNNRHDHGNNKQSPNNNSHSRPNNKKLRIRHTMYLMFQMVNVNFKL
jgi:hypothetical protein